MSLTINCACGWTVAGDEDAIVSATQEHGRRLHNMEVTREQAMAMASPAVGGDTESDEARPSDRA